MITAENSGGEAHVTIYIEVIDLPVWDLEYETSTFDLSIGDDIGSVIPTWGGGTPTTWLASPPLPDGFYLSQENGEISGVATHLQEISYHTIWANNSAGGDSAQLSFRVINLPHKRGHGPPASSLSHRTRAHPYNHNTRDPPSTPGRCTPHSHPDYRYRTPGSSRESPISEPVGPSTHYGQTTQVVAPSAAFGSQFTTWLQTRATY